MTPDEKTTVLQWSKIETNRIEQVTGETITEYINTSAIALNLLLEYGFKGREEIVHYWQFIETGFIDS